MSNSMTQALEPLMPIINTLIIVGIVMGIVVTVAFVINIVQKQRTHKAILRIDQNLQLLVDAQLGPQVEPVAKQPEATPSQQL